MRHSRWTVTMSRRPHLFLSLALLAACEGGGSDIGPEIPELSDVDYRVLVLDDQGRSVTRSQVVPQISLRPESPPPVISLPTE